MSIVNNNINKYRKLSQLTQEETAQRLKMKTSTYSQMERKGNITAEKLVDLANIFKVSPLDLLKGIYEEPKSVNNTVPVPTPPPKPIYEPKERSLSNEEKNVLDALRTLDKNEREELIKMIEDAYRRHKYRHKN